MVRKLFLGDISDLAWLILLFFPLASLFCIDFGSETGGKDLVNECYELEGIVLFLPDWAYWLAADSALLNS